ncbi:TetR family transcriptional regulator [Brachybacterium ginsengisoli]|uniref:TetR family transcriptional regulator n=1 Tax=Brachybacterium ginsengisoli TaxID=1331682 RepID=A0A291H111_9MICO|nr:TetR/AcrR family transcriptional regulator [Brachybacterium ginsengisoli]ATG56169.1 TetR family transcriptional regulator [Brachybacterium ginsengisoli]
MASSAQDPGDASLGPRARRSALRRQEILESAARTIGSRGYAGATLAAIAEDVGISAPSLLHHFRNKESLLTELLAVRDQLSRGDGETSFDAGGEARLEHLVETAELNARDRGLTQLYAVLLGESITEGHPARTYFRDRFRGLRAPVRDALLTAVADPSIPEQEVLETAAAIVAVMDGVQYQFLLEPDAVDMAAVTRRAVRALLADLRARGGADV